MYSHMQNFIIICHDFKTVHTNVFDFMNQLTFKNQEVKGLEFIRSHSFSFTVSPAVSMSDF